MRARLTLLLTDRDGRTVARRGAANAVMRQGAQLVAELFAGGGGPITHVGVGTSAEAESEAFDTDDLAGEELTGDTRVAVPAEAFTSAVDPERQVVRVRVRATLPADAAVGRIREAGLVARTDDGDVLYNRVTFDPIDKADDHELTLFWEVSFPYGDLNWL